MYPGGYLWQGVQDRELHKRPPQERTKWVGCPKHLWEGEGVSKYTFYQYGRNDEGVNTRLSEISKYLGQTETEIQNRPMPLILTKGSWLVFIARENQVTPVVEFEIETSR